MQQAVRKTGAVQATQQARDLRTALEWLRQQGDLIETDKEVDPDLQVTGLQKHMDGGCPVLFNNVKGKPNHRVAHQPVRRHERHQQDVRLEGRYRADAQDRPGVPQAAQAGDHRAERRAGAGARHSRSQGRQRAHGADPAHDLRVRAHRRLRHPLHQLRPVRWRHRPRLQPHELPLGQCRHVPDLARLAHVAGGEQILQGRQADPDDHVLRRAAGLHAARRRRLRLRHPADGLRRDRHRRRGAGPSGPHGEVPHHRRLYARRRRGGARRLHPSARPPLRDQGVGGRRRPGPFPLPSGMGRLHGQGLQGADLPRHRHHDAQAGDEADHLRARRPHARRPQHRHHGARGGDLRAVRAAAARHRPGRGHPVFA